MRVPLAVPDLNGREAEYLQECIRSTFVSTAGPFVGRFEEQIAALSGTDRASAMCTGTVALQMALEGLGIGAGDLVVLPTLTFIASANAVRHSGADVWLFDVSPADWALDLGLVRHALETQTEAHPDGRLHLGSGRIVKALMPVMIMGASLDLAAHAALAREFGLKVVVDAAAAIGAEAPGGRALGATGVDAVCYSFNGNKTITSGGGGAVAAADDDLIGRIRHVISTGRVGTAYEHDVVGYNFRITNVQAAIGVAQLERLESFLERKSEVYARYASLAERHPDLAPFPTPAAGRSTHWFSGLHYTGSDLDRWTAFREAMVDGGVDARPFWKPIHQQVPYAGSLAEPAPVADVLWQRILPLPASSGITDEELDHVVSLADAFWAHG
ncbi:PLP-dependent aminotransferase family protein [Jatrophihabitans fulvus]